MSTMFDPSPTSNGAGLSYIRVPIGATDFSAGGTSFCHCRAHVLNSNFHTSLYSLQYERQRRRRVYVSLRYQQGPFAGLDCPPRPDGYQHIRQIPPCSLVSGTGCSCSKLHSGCLMLTRRQIVCFVARLDEDLWDDERRWPVGAVHSCL